jgi:hypothetical protein
MDQLFFFKGIIGTYEITKIRCYNLHTQIKKLIGAALKDSITENDFCYLYIDFVVALLKKNEASYI